MGIIDTFDNKEESSAYINNEASTTNPYYSRESLDSPVFEEWENDLANEILPSELKFNRENKKYFKKIKQIKSVLLKRPVNLQKLKNLALSEGGLVNDEIRKTAWLDLLEVRDVEVPKFSDEKELENHPEYQQVVLDVNRSLRRFPPGIPLDHRLALQNQLTYLILRVVTTHPRLRYYQGYHDVAVTLLLVTGLDAAYAILEKLSTNHLKECMEPTMEKTSHLLNYIFPLVKHQNEEVYAHLEKSGVGTMFALPWFLTWFGHSLNQYHDVVRLFDYFLASEPLAPLYLSAVIIVFRHKEILSTPCDMANLHSLLSQLLPVMMATADLVAETFGKVFSPPKRSNKPENSLPDNLPFEVLLLKTTELYKQHPPDEIQKEASAITQREEEQRKKEYAIRKHRRNQTLPFFWRIVGRVDPDHRLPVWAFVHPNRVAHNFSRYRYLIATATFAVGLYAVYLKTVEATKFSDDR